MITLTKEQLSEVMCKHAEKENGVNDLLGIMLAIPRLGLGSCKIRICSVECTGVFSQAILRVQRLYFSFAP